MRTDRRTNNDRFLARQFRCCSPKICKAIFPRERQLLTQAVRRGPSVQACLFAPILGGPLRSSQTGARGPSFLKEPSRDRQGAIRHERHAATKDARPELRLGPPEPSPDRKGVGAACPELIHSQIRGTQRLCPVWRGSPDLPCRYSYRHLEFSSRLAVQAPSIDKSVDAADVGVRANSPLKLPLPAAKNTENRLISFHSVSPSRHKAPRRKQQTRGNYGARQ